MVLGTVPPPTRYQGVIGTEHRWALSDRGDRLASAAERSATRSAHQVSTGERWTIMSDREREAQVYS